MLVVFTLLRFSFFLFAGNLLPKDLSPTYRKKALGFSPCALYLKQAVKNNAAFSI
jgi:hypothetical protein